jgi:hypothetical protein
MADDNRAPGATHHRRATLCRTGMRVARVLATLVVGSAVLLSALAAGALVAAGWGGAAWAPHRPVRPPLSLSPPPLVRTSPVAVLPLPGVPPFVMVASLAAARAVCAGRQQVDLLGQVVAQPVQAVVIVDPALVEIPGTGFLVRPPPQVACRDL